MNQRRYTDGKKVYKKMYEMQIKTTMGYFRRPKTMAEIEKLTISNAIKYAEQ